MGVMYKKPNDMVIEVHEDSIEYVESIGWIKVEKQSSGQKKAKDTQNESTKKE